MPVILELSRVLGSISVTMDNPVSISTICPAKFTMALHMLVPSPTISPVAASFNTIMLNAILGVLAKISPQLNMFAVGIQLKILVGLSVLLLSASMLPDAANFIFRQMKETITAIVGGMT